MQHFSCVAPAAGKCGLRMHKITLCYAAGVGFFLAQAEWWWRLECSDFLRCGLAGSAAPEWSLRNEDDAVPDAGRDAKMCARKNQQKGWGGEGSKKTTKP